MGDFLEDREQVEHRARQAIDPRHHHQATGRDIMEELQQVASIDASRSLFPGNLRASGLLQLLKLNVELPAAGAEAGHTRSGKKAGSNRILREV